MTRNEFIAKYDGSTWTSNDGETRVYLSLELAMPSRNISRAMKSCKIWLDENNELHTKGLDYETSYLTEVMADAATIEE